MSAIEIFEFACTCAAVAYEWLETKFTMITVIIVLVARSLFDANNATTMAILGWSCVAYMVLGVFAFYVNRVLIPREEIYRAVQMQ